MLHRLRSKRRKRQIEAAKAAVATAQLNLGFTKVVSLIDGIAGIAQAQIGDLVSQRSLLTTVSTLDPIKVYFPVSEREYLEYVERTRRTQRGIIGAGVATGFGQRIGLSAQREDFARRSPGGCEDRNAPRAGFFPNPGNVLRPGQYARVRAIIKRQGKARCSFLRRSDGAARELSGGGGEQREQS